MRRELREAEEVASALTPREPAAAKLEQADADARERERVLLRERQPVGGAHLLELLPEKEGNPLVCRETAGWQGVCVCQTRS